MPVEKNRLWDNLSSLAYLRAKFGDFESADRLYLEAEKQISAKAMLSFAWVELQRGYLDLSRGRHEAAWDHYQRVDQAYSGYWLVKDYMATMVHFAAGLIDEGKGICKKPLRSIHIMMPSIFISSLNLEKAVIHHRGTDNSTVSNASLNQKIQRWF